MNKIKTLCFMEGPLTMPGLQLRLNPSQTHEMESLLGNLMEWFGAVP